MTRQVIRGLIVMVAAVGLLEVAVGQPGTIPDKVVVRDIKKEGAAKSYDGTLVLDKNGLRIMGGEKGDKLIATIDPNDVLKITIGELSGVDRGALLPLFGSEDKKTKKEYEAARLGYTDLLKKSGSIPERSKRFLEFKVAQMTSKIADETADDEGWATLADTAIKNWDAFLEQYKSGWELWMANRALTRLQIELNKYDRVASAWAALGKTGELPPNLALEAALQGIDAQIRSGKAAAAAETAARNLAKDAVPGPTKDKLAIYEATAKAIGSGNPLSGLKELEDKIAASKDAGVRAVGHAMRGELYMLASKPREAMWEYLWVETVYNSDRVEVLKALSRLVDVFKALGDEDRAKGCRDKIRRLRAAF